jgi:hypothetical protein
MQFEMFFEGGQAKELFQSGLLHALHVAEPHVIVDQREDLIGLPIREVQAAEDFGGHFHTYLNVSIEADAVGCDAESWGFADVVEERTPGKRF